MSGITLFNEQENLTSDEDILMEGQTTEKLTTNDEWITDEDQMPRAELPDTDSQSTICQLRQELEEYKVFNQWLQSQLQEAKMLQARPTITKEQLQEDEDMVTYYTGLANFGTLMLTFELAEKIMSKCQKNMEIEN